jgi:hypothetical protein
MNTYRPPGAGAGKTSPASSPAASHSDYTTTPPSTESTHSPAGAPSSLGPQSSFGHEYGSVGKQPRGGTAGSLTADVKGTAKTAKRAVTQQAAELAADVGHELGNAAEQQKARGVEAMQGFARAVDAAAGELQAQSPLVAGYAREAAQKVRSFSDNLGRRNVNELVRAASDLARSQPAWFFGGAIAAGFALSRFLKSSANAQDDENVPIAPQGPGI